VRVHQIGSQRGADHMDLVAEAVREAGAQRTVDQPAGEDGLIGGLALTTEERAGDATRGIHALFDVDGQGEEVRILAGRLGRGGGDEHDGVAELDGHCAISLTGELAGREVDGLVGVAGNDGVDGNGISHVCLLCAADRCPPCGGDDATSSQW
jgi:hypothetical protein